MSIFRAKRRDGKYVKEKKSAEKSKVEGRHKKGSEWKKNAQSREDWLREQGYENINNYVRKIYEDIDEGEENKS